MAKRKNHAAEDQEQDATDALRALAAAAEAEHQEEAPPAPAPARADVCTIAALHGGVDGRLARVLEHTAREHNPEWRVELRLVDPPPVDGATRTRAWRDLLDELADGDEVLLLDAATFVVGSLEDLFAQDFDLAFVEDLERVGGLDLVAVRVTARTREFFNAWADQAPELGMVAGFRKALEDGENDVGLEVAHVPEHWLAGPEAWTDAEALEAARVVLLRGDLRGNILRTSRRVEELADLVAAWSFLEAEAGRAEAAR